MAKCYHTGLPMSMCGHCNGTHAVEAEPFRGRRPSDEPRLVKLRGKVEWRGIGLRTFSDSTIPAGTTPADREFRPELTRVEANGIDINPMGLAKGSCVRRSGFSDWSRTNIMRTLLEVKR